MKTKYDPLLALDGLHVRIGELLLDGSIRAVLWQSFSRGPRAGGYQTTIFCFSVTGKNGSEFNKLQRDVDEAYDDFKGDGFKSNTALEDQFYKAARCYVDAVVRAKLDGSNDQDDLVQEILMKVWRGLPDFRGQSRASTWVWSVCDNHIKDHFDHLRSSRQKMHSSLGEVDDPIGMTHKDLEREQQLRELFESLSQEDKELMEMKRQGYTEKEIAAELDTPLGTVSAQLSRLRKELAQKNRR